MNFFFRSKVPKQRDPVNKTVVHVKTVLKLILQKLDEFMDWLHMAHTMLQWPTVFDHGNRHNVSLNTRKCLIL